MSAKWDQNAMFAAMVARTERNLSDADRREDWASWHQGQAGAYLALQDIRYLRTADTFRDRIEALRNGKPKNINMRVAKDPAAYAQGWEVGLDEAEQDFLS
ncbi:hypothetical protein [Caulobacter sp. UC70_42]|uniref:hypothetical protein n=1 Tax=Caulobacter sp. UC70_42 TaxID=3374551 RepID=UPI0037566DC3